MFYDNLEKVLKQKGLTFNKLAKGCEIAQSQTSKWKKGNLPGSEILVKICKYLNVSADYLLDLEEEAPPPKLSDQEEQLLAYFRDCDSGTQKSILLLARSGAEEKKETEKLSNSEKAV